MKSLISEIRDTNNEIRILGIDEAGRGPVIGPLVICGLIMNSSNIPELSQRGVKDSKMLTSFRRKKLKEDIHSLAEAYELIVISPENIDKEGMNDLELRVVAKLITQFYPNQVFLDAPTRNCLSYQKKIRGLLSAEMKVELVVENFADKNFPVVGAASILAKVERDRIISELAKQYGDIGSGYPSDEKTIRFLGEYFHRKKCFPPIVRKRWKTLQRIKMKEERERCW